MARIFPIFYTIKPKEGDTGLGLSMSCDIFTKGHGGLLDLDGEEGEGAIFVMTLPR